MELEEVYIEEQQQPDPPTKKRALYDAVSKKYDLGTYEDFERKLNDPTKRKSLYDYIGKEFELGTYQEFENKLNDNVKKKRTFGKWFKRACGWRIGFYNIYDTRADTNSNAG